MEATLMAHCGTRKIDRTELAQIPTPAATETHKPIAHIELVQKLEETLAFRRITIKEEEYAVSPDGHRMFGLVVLDAEFAAGRFALGIRNANDKSMRLGLVAGYKVFVCDNMAFTGDFKPVLAKHTKHFDLIDALSVGVDRIQRNFTSIESKVDDWQGRVIDDRLAKAVFWDAFTGKALSLPKSLIPAVQRHYFAPEHEEFRPRTLWSLANAFTSAFKGLKPVRQFQATAKLGAFLEGF